MKNILILLVLIISMTGCGGKTYIPTIVINEANKVCLPNGGLNYILAGQYFTVACSNKAKFTLQLSSDESKVYTMY